MLLLPNCAWPLMNMSLAYAGMVHCVIRVGVMTNFLCNSPSPRVHFFAFHQCLMARFLFPNFPAVSTVDCSLGTSWCCNPDSPSSGFASLFSRPAFVSLQPTPSMATILTWEESILANISSIICSIFVICYMTVQCGPPSNPVTWMSDCRQRIDL
jgi:hypothetical protein